MPFNREMDTESVVHLHNRVLLSYQKLHKIHRPIDGTRKYHPELVNSITKNRTWYALTDKWILAQKLELLKIPSTDHMNLKKKDNQCADASVLLKRGKYGDKVWNRDWRNGHSEHAPSGDLGHIHTAIKHRTYCWCQEAHADRSLI